VDITFTSPTSLRMKDTFIIKSDSFVKLNLNASPLKKLTSRNNTTMKTEVSDDGLETTLVNDFTIATERILNKRIVQHRRPAPRDGHSSVLVPGTEAKFMVVFGGDRHRMPFNDLYVLDVLSEIKSKVKD